jgi:hypothetical protein
VSARGTPERPFRVCLFGADAPSSGAIAGLDAAMPLVWLGPMPAPDFQHIEAPSSDDPLDVLPCAARAFPRETLILVRVDAELPTLAIPRLLRALECEGVLGAAARGVVAVRDWLSCP